MFQNFSFQSLIQSDLFKIILPVVIVGIVCVILLYLFFRNPFEEFPKATFDLDVTGKRDLDLENNLDRWLNVPDNFRWLLRQEKAIDSWHGQCADWIDAHPFKEHRKKQYRHMVPKKPFKFVMIKQQTRYRQKNYRRYSYKKSVVVDSERFTFNYLVGRHDELERLTENTCTLKQFYSNKQRGLMKAPLKQLIAERDNYTCQICGKYMPDGVGLQIDHIVPVSRGGKSVPSNLRVLCSKCNEKKGNKLDNEWNVKEWKESI